MEREQRLKRIRNHAIAMLLFGATNLAHKILGKCIMPAAVLVIAGQALAADTSESEARVTRVIRDVKLLPSESAARLAAVDDKVPEDTAVRTGEESRSELTFVDLTITRLGANTTFTFNKAGHNVQLNDGTVLLYMPKDSGGAKMATNAVSVAITGTTVVLRSTRSGHSELTVLEGGARASLIKYPRETTLVRGGQMIDVKPGATKMPRPVNISLRDAMKSPLITDFDPLPSQNLILAGIKNPTVYQSQPVGGGGSGPGRPVVGQPAGGGGNVYVPGQSGSGPTTVVVNPGRPKKPKKPKNPKATPTPTATPRGGGGKGNTRTVGGQTGPNNVPRGSTGRPKKNQKYPKPKPTPAPGRKVP